MKYKLITLARYHLEYKYVASHDRRFMAAVVHLVHHFAADGAARVRRHTGADDIAQAYRKWVAPGFRSKS